MIWKHWPHICANCANRLRVGTYGSICQADGTARLAVDIDDRKLGQKSPTLIHKEGLSFHQGDNTHLRMPQEWPSSGLMTFCRSQAYLERSAGPGRTNGNGGYHLQHKRLSLHKSIWEAPPNNLGHNEYPSCFRCHDGNHNGKAGVSITNHCSACHNLLTMDDPNPRLLTDLGMR